MTPLFLAHVAEDERVALGLARELESRGYGTWCYEIDNTAGGDYVDRILAAVRSARAIVVLLSPQSLKHRDQVAREIYEGAGKPFIPLLLDIADDEFEAVVPKPWRETFRNAVLVTVPHHGLAAAVDEMARGFEALGIRPCGVDRARIQAIEAALDALEEAPPVELAQSALRRARLLGRRVTRRRAVVGAAAALAAAAAVAAAAMVVARRGANPAEDRVFNLWMDDFSTVPAEDAALPVDRDELLDQLTPALSEVFEELLEDRQVRFLTSSDVRASVDLQDCSRFDEPPRRDGCVRSRVVGALGIDARVVGTLKARANGLRRLTLKMSVVHGGRLEGFDRMATCPDADVTTLANCGAERISAFVAGVLQRRTAARSRGSVAALRRRIGEVLKPDVDEKGLELLDRTLAPSRQGSWRLDRWLPPWTAAAYAETPPLETPSAEGQTLGTAPLETRSAETPRTEMAPAETPAAETPRTETPAAETPAAVRMPSSAPPSDAAAGVQRALEAFASSLETRDPDAIAAHFVAMDGEQRSALRAYFANMDPGAPLSVKIVEPIVAVDGDGAEASFLRVDRFNDAETHRPVRLAVRLVAILVRFDDTWKIRILSRPTGERGERGPASTAAGS